MLLKRPCGSDTGETFAHLVQVSWETGICCQTELYESAGLFSDDGLVMIA